MTPDDERQPPQQPFKFSPQVGVVILIVMAALFLPLLGVVWFASSALEARRTARATPVVVDSPALRNSLEIAADDFLGGAVVPLDAKGTETIQLPADSPWKSRLPELARSAGGRAVEMPGVNANGGSRFMVTLPTSAAAAFRATITESAPPDDGGSGAGGTTPFEVVFGEKPDAEGAP